MNPQLMRKYLDILNEQSQPPSQEFINQLDTAYRTGEGPGAEVMSGLGRDQQEMMLRNQGAWVNRDSEVQKGENPGARVFNPNQQDIDAREAGIQAMLDRQTDPEQKAQLLKGIQSREINKPYFTTTQPPATDTKAKPKPAPAQPAPVVQQGPRTTIEPEVQARVPLGDKNGLYGGMAYDVIGGAAPGNPKAQVGYQGDSGARMSIARSLDPNMPGSTEFRGSMPLTDKVAGTAVYKRDDRGASQAQVGAQYNINPTAKVSANYQQNVGGGSADPRFNVTFQKDF
jgi:hypothetical protein